MDKGLSCPHAAVRVLQGIVRTNKPPTLSSCHSQVSQSGQVMSQPPLSPPQWPRRPACHSNRSHDLRTLVTAFSQGVINIRKSSSRWTDRLHRFSFRQLGTPSPYTTKQHEPFHVDVASHLHRAPQTSHTEGVIASTTFSASHFCKSLISSIP